MCCNATEWFPTVACPPSFSRPSSTPPPGEDNDHRRCMRGLALSVLPFCLVVHIVRTQNSPKRFATESRFFRTMQLPLGCDRFYPNTDLGRMPDTQILIEYTWRWATAQMSLILLCGPRSPTNLRRCADGISALALLRLAMSPRRAQEPVHGLCKVVSWLRESAQASSCTFHETKKATSPISTKIETEPRSLPGQHGDPCAAFRSVPGQPDSEQEFALDPGP